MEFAGKLPTGMIHSKADLCGDGGSCQWRRAVCFRLPRVQEPCAAGTQQVSTSEPGREATFSCSGSQYPLLTKLNNVPDGRREMFTGSSFIITEQVIRMGLALNSDKLITGTISLESRTYYS